MTRARSVLVAVIAAAGVAAVFAAARAVTETRQPPRALASTLPEQLGDREFWQLSAALSEPGGTFHSENYISNENRFQDVLPDLLARARPAGLYIGVGPEQNFTYIAALRPRMAFIVDIRRGNLLEHLLYKALIESSVDRVEFLSRLFARPRPSGLTASATVTQIFAAFANVASSDALARTTLQAAIDRLTRQDGFTLTADDRAQLETIYRAGFVRDGPSMMYRRTDGINAGRRPTYAELMTSADGSGRQRSYLADEAAFAFVKDLETRNLVVPVVGDFGGPAALRGVGRYAREHGAIVSAFYLSNVEDYLRRDGKQAAFCATVASLPLDAQSTFIRSRSTGPAFVSVIGPMQDCR